MIIIPSLRYFEMQNTVPQISLTNILQTLKQTCPNFSPVVRTSARGNTRYYASEKVSDDDRSELRFCGVTRCCIPLESHGSGVVCTCPGMGRCSPPPLVAIAPGSSVDARCCGSFQLQSLDCTSQLENDR